MNRCTSQGCDAPAYVEFNGDAFCRRHGEEWIVVHHTTERVKRARREIYFFLAIASDRLRGWMIDENVETSTTLNDMIDDLVSLPPSERQDLLLNRKPTKEQAAQIAFDAMKKELLDVRHEYLKTYLKPGDEIQFAIRTTL